MRIHVATKGDRYRNCTHPHMLETEEGLFCDVCGRQLPGVTIEEFDNDEEIESKPELKPDEPPHWMWELASNGWANHICSRCGYTINTDIHVSVDYDSCPGCGIHMEKGEHHGEELGKC